MPRVQSASPNSSCNARSVSSRAARIFANIGIMGGFLLCTLLVLPCSYVLVGLFCLRTPGMQRAMRKLIWLYGRTTLKLISPWAPTSIVHPDSASQQKGCVIVCNHQSFLDIYLLGMQSRADICLISKGWPYRLLFFFAPAMRCAGYINVEAMDAEALEALCLQRLGEGTALVVFPEGSRSRDGSLGRFHAGAFSIAVKAGVPVCPLVIHNSFSVFAPGSRSFSPGHIDMTFLDPVWPQAFAEKTLPHRAMLRHVRALFAEKLNNSGSFTS